MKDIKQSMLSIVERRLKEIEADLLAYRNGWIEYDRAEVYALQAERAAIAKAQGRAS